MPRISAIWWTRESEDRIWLDVLAYPFCGDRRWVPCSVCPWQSNEKRKTKNTCVRSNSEMFEAVNMVGKKTLESRCSRSLVIIKVTLKEFTCETIIKLRSSEKPIFFNFEIKNLRKVNTLDFPSLLIKYYT